ncbi:MAG: MATE family efflux transporter [Thermoguttaceae bacterium]|jgi:putative MATE family efflux protein|nr:MATE family efflux transporter [Thermoguttaceae bacterium]
MERAKRLETGSIRRLVLTFSAPAIVGMAAQAIYNLVDRIFIGQAVGPLGIAGATVSFPVMLVIMAFSMLVGFGATALVSIRLGERKKAEAEQVLGNALVLFVILALLLTAVGLALLDPILTLFGASSDVLPLARDYLQIILFGTVVHCLGFGLNAVIRGEGNPGIAMGTMLIGAVLNTILDPIFLFGFGWGIRGAAAATVLSQAVSAAWTLGHFMSGRSVLTLHARNLRLRWPICLSIIIIGSPMFALQLASSAMNGILNNQLRIYGGDLAISAMGIVHAVATLIILPVFGINQGVQPIMGYNYGACLFDRVKKTLLAAILFATSICVSGYVVVMLFPSHVIALFNREDQALIELGSHAIQVCFALFPIIGFQVVSTSYFQAVGKPRQAMLLGLSRQVLLLIPAILILPRFWGLDGIWMALPVSDLGASLWTGTCLFLELRHLNLRHATRNAAEVGG